MLSEVPGASQNSFLCKAPIRYLHHPDRPYKKIAALEILVKLIRVARRYHRQIGIVLLILVLISALTGLLLAWKKESAYLQPPTTEGAGAQLEDWKPIAELAVIAREALAAQYPAEKDNAIDRMDARPSKGVVKVLFEKRWWEVQVDGTTGEVMSIAKRNSDWIEAIHDGSIISDGFKLVSMNVLGLGLLLLIVTGFFLWYGPRRLRFLKRK